ncbi:MAG: Gfo/Idh/MocA family protein [Ilumatobacteraceae bacterium]|nr:gfo/Idh/MocA family oxidoreductase [Actinomycetota bacterium]
MASPEHRFLVVGSGSAGRRHARALRDLYPRSIISVVKRSSSEQPLESLHERDISVVHSLKDGISSSPTFVVIASPATMHLADLDQLSNYCTTFLLEKPIAASASDGQRVHDLVTAKGLRVTVGHHLRFSDTPLAFMGCLKKQDRSVPNSISLSYGQHLRHWRPGVSADQSVTARKDLGGGVLRELSHEIDAVNFLAGHPAVVQESQLSYDGAPTDGRVETSADVTLSGSGIQSRIHLDMTTDVPYRHWDAVFPTFTIRADLLAGSVTKILNDGSTEVLYIAEPGERDRAARSLLTFAITGEHDSAIGSCDVAQGVHILNTIEAIEKSAMSGKPVGIAE